MKINILDGFSGIGGFSLAAKRAGFEIDKHYFSEVDKYAKQIYRYNFPGSIFAGDITKIGNELEKIDIATFGFPCQSFSIAGKRGGFEDTRGTLFFEIERLCRLYRPNYMVLENVKGLSSHEGGNTIRIILDKLRGLDYSVQLLLLNTKDFGIPQNRERFFFICTARGKRQPEISSIRERKTEIIKSNEIDIFKKDGSKKDSQIAATLTGGGHSGGNHSDMDLIAIPVIDPARVNKTQNGRRFKENGDPSFTLTAQDRHGILQLNDTGKTIRTGGRDSFSKKHNWNILNDGSVIRRLTPRECEKLQDFPIDWTKYGINEKGEIIEISDSQRYKTCGNAITVKPAELIMREIKKVFKCNTET